MLLGESKPFSRRATFEPFADSLLWMCRFGVDELWRIARNPFLCLMDIRMLWRFLYCSYIVGWLRRFAISSILWSLKLFLLLGLWLRLPWRLWLCHYASVSSSPYRRQHSDFACRLCGLIKRSGCLFALLLSRLGNLSSCRLRLRIQAIVTTNQLVGPIVRRGFNCGQVCRRDTSSVWNLLLWEWCLGTFLAHTEPQWGHARSHKCVVLTGQHLSCLRLSIVQVRLINENRLRGNHRMSFGPFLLNQASLQVCNLWQFDWED